MRYIIGVGASAGGLDALEKFFKNMQVRGDVSFVVVQHLSPDYKSLMVELLSKHTLMPVLRVENEMEVESGCVYLIPPKKIMTILGGTLYLHDYTIGERLHLPIDAFLRSLAEDQGSLAVGVILSGTGSDGTNGIRAIKEFSGMVMVQDEFSAQFDGMPKSAIYTGLVDFVLPPDEMGNKLIEYIDSHKIAMETITETSVMADEESIQRIFAHVKKKRDLDLAHYKPNTIMRRLERRMSIHNLKNLHEYDMLLRSMPEESEIFCNELLIGVTRFFRDGEAFDYLVQKVIPSICEGKTPGECIRIWVSACSTGEEVYSVAVSFLEYIKNTQKNLKLKIFATDVDRNAVEFAGVGVYPSSIVADIPQHILQLYFIPNGDYYKIGKEVREMLVFSTHNIMKDPPFNKIDLVTCRNMLIYFQPAVQKRVIGFFDYSLNHDGYLFLGPSETIGDYSCSFELVESRWKFYRHKEKSRLMHSTIDELYIPKNSGGKLLPPSKNANPITNTLDGIYRTLLQTYTIPSAIVDANYNVVLVCGGASRFLLVPEGVPTYRLVDMIAKEAVTPIMIALRRAFKENIKSSYKYKNVKMDGTKELIDIFVEMIPDQYISTKYAIVKFLAEDDCEEDEYQQIFNISEEVNARIKELESELQYTKESLQAVVEELETANEELQATNEELLSSNEELQSTNEELQSVNEELITLNSEYQMKITELTELNNDMDNFMSSTNIGTLFLDQGLLIRKFTPAITGVINLMEQDIGRPIVHISHKLNTGDLISDSLRVLETRVPIEKEVQTTGGQVFLQTIFPYLTRDTYTKGVVITFVNVTELEQVRQKVSEMKLFPNDK